MSDESFQFAKSLETFYLLHHDCDRQVPGGIVWIVCPRLVRSIERWCNQVYPLEPIKSALITDRTKVGQHFNRWLLKGRSDRQLDESTLVVEAWYQHLLNMQQRSAQSPSIYQRHWIAFFMHRCSSVAWEVWKSIDPKLASFDLFKEIISASHYHVANHQAVCSTLAKFDPHGSGFVSGINHFKTYIDRRIKYSIYPDLRKLLSDENIGRSDLGVAARQGKPKIEQAIKFANLSAPEEYILLWECFQTYKIEVGIKVNKLADYHFAEIDRIYQNRSRGTDKFPNNTDIKIKIEQIGAAVRRYMAQKIVALDKKINDYQDGHDLNFGSNPDRLKTLVSREQMKLIYIEIESICIEPIESTKKPSDRQIFWLYYGLKLKQPQIGQILQQHYGLNPNPGSVSIRISAGHQELFRRICDNHPNAQNLLSISKQDKENLDLLLQVFTGVDFSEILQVLATPEYLRAYTMKLPHPTTTLHAIITGYFDSKQAIKAVKQEFNAGTDELLTHWFELMISRNLSAIATMLAIIPETKLSITQCQELIKLSINWFYSYIQLNQPNPIVEAAILKIVNKFFRLEAT